MDGPLVIVGASLAGSRAAEAARKAEFEGEIVLLGAEPHLPYDRPPLSKELLTDGVASKDVAFHDAAFWADLDVSLRLGEPATGLDVDARTLTTAGSDITFGGLVIATGATPRSLPGTEGVGGVHVVRSIDDAAAIDAALADRPDVVVVGAGFIGSEVASSAATWGCRVTVVEMASAPLSRGLGDQIGGICGRLHQRNGTDLRLGVGVDAVLGDGHVTGVRLTDGTELDAGLVVVGIGVVPATEWLEGSGLTLDNGIVCDAMLAAGPPGVYAAGDCVRWPNGWCGEVMRLEHWTSAAEQGGAAARNLLAAPGEAVPYETIPFVWSDQYGSRIQIAGHPHGDDHVEILIGDEDGAFLAAYRRDDRLTGVMALDLIRPFVKFRLLLMRGASWADALSQAAELS